MRDFRYFEFWQKAHTLTFDIHWITKTFPKVESFGLASTLRCGSAKLAMKIAEGCGRDDNMELHRRLQQARAMGVELELPVATGPRPSLHRTPGL
jgi:four helix bundle protein